MLRDWQLLLPLIECRLPLLASPASVFSTVFVAGRRMPFPPKMPCASSGAWEGTASPCKQDFARVMKAADLDRERLPGSPVWAPLITGSLRSENLASMRWERHDDREKVRELRGCWLWGQGKGSEWRVQMADWSRERGSPGASRCSHYNFSPVRSVLKAPSNPQSCEIVSPCGFKSPGLWNLLQQQW